VGVDATLLASGPLLAPRSFRGVQSSAQLVSSLLAVVHSLTFVFPCREPPIPQRYLVDNSDPTGTDPHDEGKNTSRPGLPNTGDGALSRRESRNNNGAPDPRIDGLPPPCT